MVVHAAGKPAAFVFEAELRLTSPLVLCQTSPHLPGPYMHKLCLCRRAVHPLEGIVLLAFSLVDAGKLEAGL